MQLKFNQAVIPCYKSAKREVKGYEQTQEVRLTEGMPDIGRILASWGQPVIRSKEWRSGHAGASGGVMAWVLYEPEDGGAPRCVETWLPIQMKWELPDVEQDGVMEICPGLCSVDARSLSARKIMVRANMDVLAEMWIPDEIAAYTPDSLPADVEILRNTYPMQIPVEIGEFAFALDDVLSLPSTAPELGKIMRYCLRPVIMEQKIVTDKLVIRGIANLHLLYLGTDDKLHTYQFELPFSQYVELHREYEGCPDARIRFAVTALELDSGEEESLNLKAGITAQYVIYDCVSVEVVEDMYCPKRHIEPDLTQQQIPSRLDAFNHSVQAECSWEDMLDVVDVTFGPEQPRIVREGDQVIAELSGIFQVLGYDELGMLRSNSARWESEWPMDADQGASVYMYAESAQKPEVIPGGDGLQMRADVTLQVQTVADRGIPVIMGAEVGEKCESDTNQPSLVLQRAEGQTLWEIAKATGSTVAAIRNANGLTQEPDAGQMLLIPVS